MSKNLKFSALVTLRYESIKKIRAAKSREEPFLHWNLPFTP